MNTKSATRAASSFWIAFFLPGRLFVMKCSYSSDSEFLLRRYEAIQVQPLIQMGEYFSLVSRLVLAFGVMFQLPVVAYFLSRVGMIDHRFLIRHMRYAVIGIAILAAVLTPPDLISQVLFMVPLALLYAVEHHCRLLCAAKRRLLLTGSRVLVSVVLRRLVVSNVQTVVVDENAGSKYGGPQSVLITDGGLGDIGCANYLFRHFEKLFTLVPSGIRVEFDA